MGITINKIKYFPVHKYPSSWSTSPIQIPSPNADVIDRDVSYLIILCSVQSREKKMLQRLVRYGVTCSRSIEINKDDSTTQEGAWDGGNQDRETTDADLFAIEF